MAGGKTARRRRVPRACASYEGDDPSAVARQRAGGWSAPATEASATGPTAATRGERETAARVAERLAQAFPLWVVAGAVTALWRPEAVTWFAGDAMTAALSFTMLGMGLTLKLADFVAVARVPGAVVAGAALQYTIMPLLGYWVGKLFALPTPLAIGLILVGSCPGGTASNVVTYIARANVALSVALTTISTVAAVVLTPTLTSQLVGAMVDVDAAAMLISTLQVVLAPIAAGLALQRLAPRAVKAVAPFCPLLAVACVALICASIIGQNQMAILGAGVSLIAAVATLHSAGFLLGYITPALLRFDEGTRRTISIEVGMQNSALGVVLARAHFADPLVSVPAAISATLHSGELLRFTRTALLCTRHLRHATDEFLQCVICTCASHWLGHRWRVEVASTEGGMRRRDNNCLNFRQLCESLTLQGAAASSDDVRRGVHSLALALVRLRTACANFTSLHFL